MPTGKEILDAYRDQTDEIGKFKALEEMIDEALEIQNRPVPQVGSKDLLVRLNTYIDDMRGKEYEYNEKYDDTGNPRYAEAAEMIDLCMTELVNIVKAY